MTTCDPCDHPTCDDCERPMVSQLRWQDGDQPAGHVKHGGRGMCSACYQAWVSRQKTINSPEWSGPARPPRVWRDRHIGGWAAKAQERS